MINRPTFRSINIGIRKCKAKLTCFEKKPIDFNNEMIRGLPRDKETIYLVDKEE